MNRKEILAQATKLTMGDRNESHGEPYANHKRIADIWSAIIGIKITPYQAALMMAGQKLARAAYKPLEDSFVDLAAYAAIAGEIASVGGEIVPTKEVEKKQ